MSAKGDGHIRRVAVLGAGVMGAQIAAHLANAGVAVVLFELPADGGDKNANVKRAIAGLRKLEPSPLATADRAAAIQAANYAEHLELLGGCDLVIEAIAERMDWKADLYNKVAPHLDQNSVFVTNTSGLSITSLAKHLSADQRKRFCGMHFFNPPRYMHLVELIPGPDSDSAMLDRLEQFLVTTLGKGVVYAKDTTNFIANRVGVYSMLATIHHADEFGIAPDVVDALTGPAIGRPKSATYRTADVVGLDTFGHVVHTMTETLPDDPWHKHYKLADWLAKLIEEGALGQKTRRGVYVKEGKTIKVLDTTTGEYRPAEGKVDDGVQQILKRRDPAKMLSGLRDSNHPQAQFLWACFRDVFHYCAVHLEAIADNARDLDLAIRWGFGWKLGPFETWQLAGWRQVAGWVQEDIEAGKTMSAASLPSWVGERDGVYDKDGAYAPGEKSLRPRSELPVYRRQRFPEQVVTETTDPGETVFEDDDVRLWHDGDGVAVLSFKTKMHVIGAGVLSGIQRAIEVTEDENEFRALVLWHPQEPFSAGANLGEFVETLQKGDFSSADAAVANFQQTALGLRYSMMPTVAATRGLTLGGGCEFMMHCDRRVAALESYVGLVEAGVGLLPAGGGCKELALRSVRDAKVGDSFPFLARSFEMVAKAVVAKSAGEARDLGFLAPDDPVIFNPHELLHVAKAQAIALAETGYRPPPPPTDIPVLGASGAASMKMLVVNMLEGGFISEHDAEIAGQIASVLCGGDLPAGSRVDENWFLTLERKAFLSLAQMPKTQERIKHTLTTGKPLRN